MYFFVSAFADFKDSPQGWREVNIENMPIDETITTYRNLVWVVRRPLYNDLRLIKVTELINDFSLTIEQRNVIIWLEQHQAHSLPNYEYTLPLIPAYLKYRDLYQAGYNAEPACHLKPYAQQARPRTLPDLLITKPGMAVESFYQHTLVSVNGLLHRLSFDGERIYVLSGAQSGFCADCYHVGLYDFSPLGSIIVKPIPPVLHEGTHPYTERVIVSLEVDVEMLKQTSVLLVIGGYIHHVDGKMIEWQSPTMLRINFTQYPHLQRLYEMSQLMDTSRLLSSLSIDKLNRRHWSVEECFSDGVIERLFSLPQSFIVFVNTPQLFLELQPVEWSSLPGVFYSKDLPVHPLTANLGAFYEYWIRHEYDTYVLSTDVRIQPQYAFETTQWSHVSTIDDTRLIQYTPVFKQAAFYKLGAFK